MLVGFETRAADVEWVDLVLLSTTAVFVAVVWGMCGDGWTGGFWRRG